MVDYIVNHWYFLSVLFSFTSYVSLFVFIKRFIPSEDKYKNISNIFKDFLSLEFLFLLTIPGINILGGLLYIWMIRSIVTTNKENKIKELNQMNDFYRTGCCDVLIRIHHLYRYNGTTKHPEITRCIACEEQIDYGSLSKSFDDLNDYNSDIPYQTKLSIKDFKKFNALIKKDKINELYKSEEEKFVQLKLKKLDKLRK